MFYDEFHAPQYVDFTSSTTMRDDSLNSSFFERASEAGEESDVSSSSLSEYVTADSSVSDGDRTLTPGLAALEQRRPMAFKHSASTPIRNHVEINVIPPTPVSVIDDTASITPRELRRRSRSNPVTPVVCIDSDPDVVLEDAMKGLRLRIIKKSPVNAQSEVRSASSHNQHFVECVPSGSKSKKSSFDRDDHRPKRKLSPGPRNALQTIQQPLKYMSADEEFTVVHKRIGNLPKKVKTSNVHQANSGKLSKVLSKPDQTQEKGQECTKENIPEAGRRVARWPRPTPAKFTVTEYKKKDVMPSTSVREFNATSPVGNSRGHNPWSNQDQGRKVVGKLPLSVKRVTNDRQYTETPVSNLCTPYSKIKTKLEGFNRIKVIPFSFDQRDQELLQRRSRQLRQEDPERPKREDTSREIKMKRRSKSEGPRPSFVHHAREPTVLYKPPFIPRKAEQPPTKPSCKVLCTEARAIKRKEFENELCRKNELRKALLQEHQKKEEEIQEKQLKILRKKAVHKARPMPHVPQFKVQPSKAPLTEPVTPFKRHRQQNISSDANASTGSNDTQHEEMDC